MTLHYTPGEPAGIGPDLILQAACDRLPDDLLVVGDPALLHQRAKTLGLAVTIEESDQGGPFAPGRLRVLPVPLATRPVPGRPDPANAPAVLESLEVATRRCLAEPNRHALVTGPLHKGVINQAGIPFTGHTEFLAGLTGGHPVMMLACPGLRVALATTHLPLRAVADAITPQTLETVLTILHRSLIERFAIPRPRIAVCGLNPHAGENGHLGDEEQRIIIPVLEALRARGLDLRGPLPADTLFTPAGLEGIDAVLAMYHDQGLPVLKHLGFGRAVNITLGLPIVRTSVDHGTAFDLAGSGRADTGSLQAALESAAAMLKKD